MDRAAGDAKPLGHKENGDYTVIGKPFRRVDGVSKGTGRTKYAGDLSFPGMLWCKILRSHVAHGNIRSIDTSKLVWARIPS